ncbi:hypothetical protein QTQ03_22005 [Micromonospora sp. WMMA1363]|uniref:hypothetical protein n=1 Tax=Micromonospora sp. WMMA1363 TaxID=3053985 RepID=UPI00259CC101|nr:hypothetical protein [Micromonospora sp. WMMA1363]MDM4721901.1 hypothetical protein [Micromonospora sp. WMMA1363]MDM4722133.1 hypothetical protein [Micromonospora sp. WMMA1363]
MTDESGKADFSGIYNQKTPRAYYTNLRQFRYEIPQHGATVFNQLINARPWGGDHRPTVLDVCCSYGIVGLLTKTDLALDDVYTYYQSAVGDGRTVDQVRRAESELLSQRTRPGAPHVLGLDVAENAARHAVAVGALDGVFIENLEAAGPSPELAKTMPTVDLITTTGGIGYVTERTFGRLLTCTEKPPWVAAFCLRTYDYGPISEVLAGRGLVTEKADQPVRQRQFIDDAEREWALSELAARGLDPSGMEADGYFYADFYLSRPLEDAIETPLADLVVIPSAGLDSSEGFDPSPSVSV